ncbi:MAG: hypothetical protein OES70_14100, partial [Desulfobacterales bacterium]|nr:hypothetical protein [Desulfobacterales bacterium]
MVSTITRKAGGLDFTAIGCKRQGREVPQSLRVEPGAKHPVWKTQSFFRRDSQAVTTNVPCIFWCISPQMALQEKVK